MAKHPTSTHAGTGALGGVASASLLVVALASMALSYDSVRHATEPYFGHWGALAVPLVADLLALGCSAEYVRTIRERGAGGRWWQLTAHVAIGVSVVLNVSGTEGIGRLYHAVPPLALAVLLELYARKWAATWRVEHHTDDASIPLRLWLTAPVEQVRTVLRAARTGATVIEARRDAGLHEAAHLSIEALAGRKVSRRRLLRAAHRQLSMGAVLPTQVLSAAHTAQPLPTWASTLLTGAHYLPSLPTSEQHLLTTEQHLLTPAQHLLSIEQHLPSSEQVEPPTEQVEQVVSRGWADLSRSEQLELLIAARAEQPTASDSELARALGTTRQTVQRLRSRLTAVA